MSSARLFAAVVMGCVFAPGAAAHTLMDAGRGAQGTDACALLTSEEIARVQGEPVRDATPSRMPNPQFTMAQCVYTLDSSSKGISLSVAEPAGERPDAVREFWRDRFRTAREQKARARAAAGREPQESAEPVPGIGDEAFWVGDVRIGSLYVLAGGRFFRISIGGVSDPEQRRTRSLELARAVLTRLSR